MIAKSHYPSAFQLMQEEEVVRLAREGAPGATEFLIGRYRSLVETKARTFYLRGADQDDVIQEGMIGLCKAIRDYRDERCGKFKPFAELCVTRQIITAVKTATRFKHAALNGSVSLDQRAADGSEVVLVDTVADFRLPSPDSALMEGEFPRRLQDLVRHSLSDLERYVLTSFLEGKSYKEMGQVRECRTKSIDNALQRVKKKIGLLLKE